MAEREPFVCPVCKDDFKDPRLLPCFHTFCKQCLNNVITVEFKDGLFECPLCHEEIRVPRNGAKGFIINSFLDKESKLRYKKRYCESCDDNQYATSKCHDCANYFCEKCLNVHDKVHGAKDHYVQSVVPESLATCRYHERLLDYFCDTCKSVVCSKCTDRRHKSHLIRDLASAADRVKDRLHSFIQADSDDYKSHFARQQRRYFKDEQRIMDALEDQVRKFDAVLEDVRRDFVRQLLEALSDSKNDLISNKTSVSKITMANDHLRELARRFIKNANDSDIVKYGYMLEEKLIHLDETLLSRQKIKFIPHDVSMVDVKRLFGHFSPSKYDTTHKNRVTVLGSFHGSLEDCAITSLVCLPDDTLWICFGSNGVLEKYSFNGQRMELIKIEHRIDDIAADQFGKIFVTCNAAKKIICYNNKSRKRDHFIDTDFCVRGIDIDTNNDVLVGMTESDVFFGSVSQQIGTVATISKDKIIRKFYTDELIQYPARIAVNSRNIVAVCDWIRLCVIIFRGKNKIGYFDGKRDGFDNFTPRGICSTNNDHFIVVDTGSCHLHLISDEGILKKTVHSKTDIGDPYSVTVDQHDCIWIGTKDGRVVHLCA